MSDYYKFFTLCDQQPVHSGSSTSLLPKEVLGGPSNVFLELHAISGGWEVSLYQNEDILLDSYMLYLAPKPGLGFRHPWGGGDPTPAGWQLHNKSGYYLKNVGSFEDGLVQSLKHYFDEEETC